MEDNGLKNGALIGSLLIGASIGMFAGTKVTSTQKRKAMKSAKKAKSTLKDSINSLWE